MRTRPLIATCGHCGEEVPVIETYWPQTLYDPATGEWSPEECTKCGEPFDDATVVVEDEPPEPDPYEGRYDDD